MQTPKRGFLLVFRLPFSFPSLPFSIFPFLPTPCPPSPSIPHFSPPRAHSETLLGPFPSPSARPRCPGSGRHTFRSLCPVVSDRPHDVSVELFSANGSVSRWWGIGYIPAHTPRCWPECWRTSLRPHAGSCAALSGWAGTDGGAGVRKGALAQSSDTLAGEGRSKADTSYSGIDRLSTRDTSGPRGLGAKHHSHPNGDCWACLTSLCLGRP